MCGRTSEQMDDLKGKIYIVVKMLLSSGFIGIAFTRLFIKGEMGNVQIIALGLVFCWIGDLFLAFSDEIKNLKKEPYFTVGVLSFLIAQIMFCYKLIVLVEGDFRWTIGIALLLPIVMLILVKTNVFECDMPILPILLYSTFIGGFCGLGLNHILVVGLNAETVYLGVGACLFFTSDLILSVRCFGNINKAWLTSSVLITYYMATYLIAFYL